MITDKSSLKWGKRVKRMITLVEGLNPAARVTKAQKRSINYLLETATFDDSRRNRSERPAESATKEDAAPKTSTTY